MAVLAALILGGGIHPQPGIASRNRAARSLLKDRVARRNESDGKSAAPAAAEGTTARGQP